jgi:hypothetical protein
MERVTLYTANRKVVTAHAGYIPVTSRTNPIVFSWNSPDVFLKDEIKVDHLPVKRFCFRHKDDSIENRFVAFDRELEEVIQVMLDDYTRELQYGYKKARESLINSYESRIKDLEHRSIWDMIKLKFSKVWL